MDQAEYLNKREEYVAKAALMGMTYDWFDHTFNRPPHESVRIGAAIFDPDTLEVLADASKDNEHYNKVISERAEKYGNVRNEARPDHGEDGTSEGNG